MIRVSHEDTARETEVGQVRESVDPPADLSEGGDKSESEGAEVVGIVGEGGEPAVDLGAGHDGVSAEGDGEVEAADGGGSVEAQDVVDCGDEERDVAVVVIGGGEEGVGEAEVGDVLPAMAKRTAEDAGTDSVADGEEVEDLVGDFGGEVG